MLNPAETRPTLLLVTPQLPYPPQQGTSLRNFNLVQGLSRLTRLTLLSLVEEGMTDPGPLAAWCEEIVTLPAPQRSRAQRWRQLLLTRQADMAQRLYTPALATALRALLQRRHFDIIQLEGIELARLIADARAAAPTSRIVFDNHNAETALQQRVLATDRRHPTRWPAAAYSWVQVGRLRRLETWACRQADAVTLVSEADRQNIARLLGEISRPLTVIPNCIDVLTAPAAAAPDFRYDLVFTGKMDFRPNVDAVLWFAQTIWPRIRQARPHTTWAIVGQKPHARLAGLSTWPGVTVTDRVPDTRPYLAGAQVIILPLRMGSGTRLKLIEAMAAGKALVSTTVGAEGYPARSGEHLCLADEPAVFAATVLRLLADSAERERLGQAARQFAQQYDWRVVVPAFGAVYQQLLQRRQPPP